MCCRVLASTQQLAHVTACVYQSAVIPDRLTIPPVGNIVDVTLSTAGSKVIMLHSSAGYSCGYGFLYQLRGEVELRLQTRGGGQVVWEAEGDTHQQWVQVSQQCTHFMLSKRWD